MALRDIRGRDLARLVPFYLAGFAVAWALKAFYSQAGADALSWILAPVAWLAGALGGIPFEREPHAGWVSHAHGVIVGPSCAGLNFLIIAFMTCLSFVHRLSRTRARVAWLFASLAAAYVLTIVVNAQRVIATVHLRHWDIYGEVVTQQRAHRAAGALIYCFALLLFYEAIDRVFVLRGRSRAGVPETSPLVPVAWYLAVALGVPIINRAYVHDPAEFLEHGALVAAVSLLAAVSIIILRAGRMRRSGPA